MKKVLLTAMAILTLASTSVFGMYGKGDSWIDFLEHGNQFRARMDQLGFVLGNGTIKGTFGFRANSGYMGSIISSGVHTGENQPKERLDATISAGIAYTSSMISVGVGYNYTFVDNYLGIHTPVLMINAMNNALKISAPIQVAVSEKFGGVEGSKYTGIAFDNIQLRYATGVEAFNEVRFYAYYRNTIGESSSDSDKSVSEALGFQLRLYFLKTVVGNATVNPYLRLEYHTALRGSDLYAYSADYGLGVSDSVKQSDLYEVSPFEVVVKPTLALSAGTDVVSLLFEPTLGYKVYAEKRKGAKEMSVAHTLAWGAYTELYFTPVKDLEWYFEMDVNGNVTGSGTGIIANESLAPVLFETTTGLTWYLPSFGGDAAAAQ